MNKLLIPLAVAGALLAPASAIARDASSPAPQAVSTESTADGGAAIEVAGTFLRQGRTADAMTAYRHALALDNVMMVDRFGDSIWSHQIARQALAHEVTLTAR